MYEINGKVLYKAFEEINRVLFFNQLRIDETVIAIDPTISDDFSYCYREKCDGVIYLGVYHEFEKEEHFRYVMVLEMIKLYQLQIKNYEPKYDTVFYSFLRNAENKFKSRIKDPHI